MKTKYLSRKFIFAVVVEMIGTVMVYTGQLSGSQWLWLTNFIYGGYNLSNVWQKKGGGK